MVAWPVDIDYIFVKKIGPGQYFSSARFKGVSPKACCVKPGREYVINNPFPLIVPQSIPRVPKFTDVENNVG